VKEPLFLVLLQFFVCLIGSGAFFSDQQEIDEYELVEPVDILTPLEKSGFWHRVVSFILRLWMLQLCQVNNL